MAKKPTPSSIIMSDIATLAKVSKSTVSRALAGSPLISEETRTRIIGLARTHGYAVNPVARSLKMGRTQTIAVMIPLRHAPKQHVYDPFFAEMLAHLGDALNAKGYDLLLHRVGDKSEDWLDQPIRSRRADGAIVVGQSLEHKALNMAADRGIPFVVWGALLARQKYICVGTNNFEGGVIATHHLLERNRRHIAFLGDHRAPEVAERYRGYIHALTANGIVPDATLDLSVPFGAEDVFQVLKTLCRSKTHFDGIVAASDVIAMSAIGALSALGRSVPQDVSVIGFDDIRVARYASPPLTTVHQSVGEGAEQLVERLLDLLAGRPAKSTQIAPRLVVRESS